MARSVFFSLHYQRDVLRALRRENTRLQAENDILKKAAIILGSRTPLNCAP